MTGPASRVERDTGMPLRSTGTQGAVGAVLVVLALGLALRLIIAYLFPGSGFGVDLAAFRFWAGNLASQFPTPLLRDQASDLVQAWKASSASVDGAAIAQHLREGFGLKARGDAPATAKIPKRADGAAV